MILNKKNVDYTKNKLFLGEGLALQRYDKFKYPEFFDLFSKQLTFFWRPEEVDLNSSRSDYQDLADHEKFIFTRNLLYQTMMDSVVARGAGAFTKYVTNPELEACMNVWQFFETIHSYSYTYIIKNVYPNPSSILDEALTDKEILVRADSITKAYDNLNDYKGSENKLKEQIYLSLIDVNILESVRFYVSFICAFAFAENKKMIGNADIIKLIRRDECVDEETQLLTESGWKFASKIKDEKIAQYNQDGTIDFVDIANSSTSEVDKLYRFKNKLNHLNLSVSENHRIIYKEKNKFKEQKAINFTQCGKKYIPLAGKKNGKVDNLTDFERLMIAYQADGKKLRSVDNGKRNGGFYNLNFLLKKERKVARLEELIENCGFEYKDLLVKNRDGYHKFVVRIPIENNVSKYFKDWVVLKDKSYKWCQEFIDEVSHWDGYIKDDRITYGSTIESNSEIVQTIAILAGYRAHWRCIPDNRRKTFSDYYRLQINKSNDSLTAQKLEHSVKNGKFRVYGFEVPSGMILIRRNGAVSVTGNSLHYRMSQRIIEILHKDESEGFTKIVKPLEDKAIEMFVFAAEEEKSWAKHLFKDGSILGLNENILSQYIEWLTDSRMKAIGLPQQFGSKNPISWSDAWINPSSVQNANQENVNTSYLISSSVNDVGSMSYDEL